MNISFAPLSNKYFSLLLKWLESPHVKAWWDKDTVYTLDRIEEKFGPCVHGKTLSNFCPMLTYAYIVYIDDEPIGYIQLYDAIKYLREKRLNSDMLPAPCAGLDMFIGNESFLGKGLGSFMIKMFWEKEAQFYFKACIVDPDASNINALRAYKNAGFYPLNLFNTKETTWLIRYKQPIILYLIGKPGTGKYTISLELSKAGYLVCDNQLINAPIFTVFGYDSFSTKFPRYGWTCIGKIREAVFDFIISEKYKNYVLTNVLCETQEDHDTYTKVEQMAFKRSSLFIPVKLILSEEENLRRVTMASRKERQKTTNPKDILSLSLINITHPNLLELDVTHLLARDAAQVILKHAFSIGD